MYLLRSNLYFIHCGFAYENFGTNGWLNVPDFLIAVANESVDESFSDNKGLFTLHIHGLM